MIRILIFITILFCFSCKNKKENTKEENTIFPKGLYHVIEPIEESNNLYIFSKDEIYHILNWNCEKRKTFKGYSTFKYYKKKNKIFGCLKGVINCSERENYELLYIINSIDTINNHEVIILNDKIKISKRLNAQ